MDDLKAQYKEEFNLARKILAPVESKEEADKAESLFLLVCCALNVNEIDAMVFFYMAENPELIDDDECATILHTYGEAVSAAAGSLFRNGLAGRHESGGESIYFVNEEHISEALSRYMAFRKENHKRAMELGCADSDVLFLGGLSGGLNSFPKENLCRLVLSMKPEGRVAAFIRENDFMSLPPSAQYLFWAICSGYLYHFTGAFEQYTDIGILDSDKDYLISKGWIETFTEAQGEHELEKKDNTCLAASVVKQLFRGIIQIPYRAAANTLGTFVPNKDIVPKPLYFNAEDAPQISKLYKMAGVREYTRITSALSAQGLRASLSVILYGPSGTGKTELVRQIARMSGRDILMVDAAKLYGSYWGEDERNVRDLFRLYRHIEALSECAPILFVDECEGLLGRRVPRASTRHDRSNNVVQNIFLEELNQFRGLLFVTTNNISNLDPAMDRRFLLKLHFHMPDARTRALIWQSRMPELSDHQIASIARKYNLTGAQIDNIVSLATIDAILDDSYPSPKS